jgi:transposase
MEGPMTARKTFVGIDIAKADVVVASRPDGTTWMATNDPGGIRTTCARLQGMAPARVVLEATGGYETALAAALVAGPGRTKPSSGWRR